MTKIQNRALSYLQAVYKGREVRMSEAGFFEVRSSADRDGKTYFSQIAYIGTKGVGKDCIIDVTGDDDSILVSLA